MSQHLATDRSRSTPFDIPRRYAYSLEHGGITTEHWGDSQAAGQSPKPRWAGSISATPATFIRHREGNVMALETIEEGLRKVGKHLEQLRKDSVADFVASVAEWLSYQMLFSTRMRVDHADDPPWDCSGRAVDTGKPYDPAAYPLLVDFLAEYTGASTASFESGCGLWWNTHEDLLNEMATTAASDWLADALASLRLADPDAFAVVRELAANEYPGSPLVDEQEMVNVLSDSRVPEVADAFGTLELSVALLEAVWAMPVADLLQMGRQEAEKARAAEAAEAAQVRFRWAVQQERIEKAVADLGASCPAARERFCGGRSVTIGKSNPGWKAIRQVLSSWSAEDLCILSDSGLFSNTISNDLSNGHV